MGVKDFFAGAGLLSGLFAVGCLIEVAIAAAVVGGLTLVGVNAFVAIGVFVVGRLIWSGIESAWDLVDDAKKQQRRRDRLAAKKAEPAEAPDANGSDAGS